MAAYFPGTVISIKSDGVRLVDLKWDMVPVLFAFLANVEIAIMLFYTLMSELRIGAILKVLLLIPL